MGRKSGLDGGSEIFSSILIKIPKNRDFTVRLQYTYVRKYIKCFGRICKVMR